MRTCHRTVLHQSAPVLASPDLRRVSSWASAPPRTNLHRYEIQLTPELTPAMLVGHGCHVPPARKFRLFQLVTIKHPNLCGAGDEQWLDLRGRLVAGLEEWAGGF